MCTDTDTATDPDTDTFILIGPCSDLCRTVWINGWACPIFSSIFVPFPAILFPAGGRTMPKISKITREDTEQIIELVCENVPLHDQSSSDYSNAPFISLTVAFCVVYTGEKLAALRLPLNRRPTMVWNKMVPWLMEREKWGKCTAFGV